MSRGRFITIEGSEGVGKTTNAELVRSLIEAAGFKVIATREPGGTPLAESIRDTLLAVRDEVVAPETELLMMFAARAQHLAELIRPRLAEGIWVVCDRFTDATYAYQGGGRGVSMQAIGHLEEIVHGDLQPDLTLYLDVPVQVAFERIADRVHDRIERESKRFFESVRSTYLARAAEFDRFVVIDASVPLPEVAVAIEKVMHDFLARNP